MPFPEMDPYLEALALWTAVHSWLIASTDFANTALDLGSKLGIELPTAP
jgi:hypothetical protein